MDYVAIFTKPGLLLYGHQSNNAALTKNSKAAPNSLSNRNRASKPTSQLLDLVNNFVVSTLLESSNSSSAQKQTVLYSTNQSTSSIKNDLGSAPNTGTVAEWEFSDIDDSQKNNLVAVLFYSEILRNRKDMSFVKRFLKNLLKEYVLFYNSTLQKYMGEKTLSASDKSILFSMLNNETQKFDKTCDALWKREEIVSKRMVGDDKNTSTSKDLNRIQADASKASNSSKDTSLSSKQKKKGKEKTVWHDGSGKITKAAIAQLDRSRGSNNNLSGIDQAMADDSAALREARAAYLPSSGETPSWLEKDEEVWDDESDVDANNKSSWSIKGLINDISGKTLTDKDLEPPLKEMESMLVSKNVAQDIVSDICDGVKGNLRGKRLHTFSRVKSTVRYALEDAISKILSPHKNVDILREVVTKRDSLRNRIQGRRPYVIVMVGINGVGKSTSLAKLAYYLKTNGCSPMVAACDTFRSGAVEQLGVHAKCLDIPLFHKGYAKDPSSVAQAAIEKATEEGNDCVLIDTAGRMQNNLPLMNALRKLVQENNPDMVCFVGEALVGNDGLNQLQMFDRSLSTQGRGDGKHGVDGIILSKFDTVGEKVGAALSMVKLSGKPILFVGVGQKYGHLMKLSVNNIVRSLFK